MARIPDDALAIVKRTRKWAETKGRELKFCEGLSGMCAIAAAELFRRLNRDGHPVKLAMARRTEFGRLDAHVFVVYKDKYILDITATQFGYEPVEVRWFRNFMHPWFWKAADIYPDDVELEMAQVRIGWSPIQLANTYTSSWRTT